MTALRDPFAVTHKKDIKGKGGVVVASVDYIGWSQSADRLDEATDGWSFMIMAVGEDWVHGRLTIGNQYFENIGYAENAEAEWKKEVLKDAASDAFKRCAALAGVGRYLYDKDAPRPQPVQSAPQRPAEAPQRPRAVPVDTDILEPDPDDYEALETTAPMRRPEPEVCPWHPNREPKTGKYGLFCSGQGGNGPLNAKGYCDYKFAA